MQRILIYTGYLIWQIQLVNLHNQAIGISYRLYLKTSATNKGSTTTDRNKLTANQLTSNKLTVNNADWLRTAILNIFLLSPEPPGPNSHFVTK